MSVLVWDRIPVKVQDQIARFLSCVQRAKLLHLSKSFRRACASANVLNAAITDGCLPENAASSLFNLLNLLRMGVYELELKPLLSLAAARILSTGYVPDLFARGLTSDINALNSKIFQHWDCDFSGKNDSGLFNYMKHLPDWGISENLMQLQHWPKSRISGEFYVLMGRLDGTVVVFADLQTVYLVVGIAASVRELQAGPKTVPVKCKATFLPFDGYIASDGFVAQYTDVVSPAVCKRLYRAYAAAMDSGTLRTSLPLKSVFPRHSLVPTGAPCLRPQQRMVMSLLRGLGKKGVWLFKKVGEVRVGGECRGTLVAQRVPSGEEVGRDTTACSRPVAKEMLDILFHAVIRRGAPCPAVVMVEELSALAPLQALLEPVGMQVLSATAQVPTPEALAWKTQCCALCHTTPSLLAQRGLPAALELCGRCRAVQYCSRECQKAHWKAHKKDCLPPNHVVKS